MNKFNKHGRNEACDGVSSQAGTRHQGEKGTFAAIADPHAGGDRRGYVVSE
jgi:hypothetical protein